MIEKILRSLFLKQNKSPVSKSFSDWLYPTNISMFKFSDKDEKRCEKTKKGVKYFYC